VSRGRDRLVHVSLGRVGNEAEHFPRGRIDIAEGEPSPPSRGITIDRIRVSPTSPDAAFV